MPSPNSDRKEANSIVVTEFGLTRNGTYTILSTNSSLFASFESTDNVGVDTELEYWPNWVHKVTCVSHLSLALNSSVNFFIYYFKRQARDRGKV